MKDFYLSWERLTTNPRPKAIFSIQLRADDIGVLELIRSYFQCGKPVRIGARKKSKPVASYCVNAVCDTYNIICPHFTNFPLVAKKANDFLIWKKAVAYIHAISLEKGGSRCRPSKWTPKRIDHIKHLTATLKNQRQFIHPDESIVEQCLEFPL